jgi:hypothetical protein
MSEETAVVHRNSKTGQETLPSVTGKLPRRRAVETKQKRQRKSGAAATIDRQLSEALQERKDVGKKLCEAAGLQARYQQLSAEINELLGMQSRMSGDPGIVPTGVSYGPTSSPTFSLGAPIPSGVGSIPARTPAPATANVAENVGKEGGFE